MRVSFWLYSPSPRSKTTKAPPPAMAPISHSARISAATAADVGAGEGARVGVPPREPGDGDGDGDGDDVAAGGKLLFGGARVVGSLESGGAEEGGAVVGVGMGSKGARVAPIGEGDDDGEEYVDVGRGDGAKVAPAPSNGTILVAMMSTWSSFHKYPPKTSAPVESNPANEQ